MRAVLIAVALAAFLVTSRAVAEPMCAPYVSVAKYLMEDYGENIVGRAVVPGGGAVLEVWANAQTGSMTLLLVRPPRVACFMLEGEAWRFVSEPLVDIPMGSGS